MQLVSVCRVISVIFQAIKLSRTLDTSVQGGTKLNITSGRLEWLVFCVNLWIRAFYVELLLLGSKVWHEHHRFCYHRRIIISVRHQTSVKPVTAVREAQSAAIWTFIRVLSCNIDVALPNTISLVISILHCAIGLTWWYHDLQSHIRKLFSVDLLSLLNSWLRIS